MRVDIYDSSGDRADEEMTAISEDVHAIIPEVLLAHERIGKAEAELLSSVVGQSVVSVNVIVNERGGLQDDDVVACSMLF